METTRTRRSSLDSRRLTPYLLAALILVPALLLVAIALFGTEDSSEQPPAPEQPVATTATLPSGEATTSGEMFG